MQWTDEDNKLFEELKAKKEEYAKHKNYLEISKDLKDLSRLFKSKEAFKRNINYSVIKAYSHVRCFGDIPLIIGKRIIIDFDDVSDL